MQTNEIYISITNISANSVNIFGSKLCSFKNKHKLSNKDTNNIIL